MSDDYDDNAPGDEYSLLMSLCPPSIRDYARNLLADCNELWADVIDAADDTTEEPS